MFILHTIAILKTLVAIAVGLMLGFPLYRWNLFCWMARMSWRAIEEMRDDGIDWFMNKIAERKY